VRRAKVVKRPVRKVVLVAPPRVSEVETYRDPSYTLSDIGHSSGPSVGNGELRVRRYRVTAELIDEPLDVLRQRVTDLWETTASNHHDWDAFKIAWSELGMTPPDLGTQGCRCLAKVRP
jgi:hypothetical protein